MKPHTTAQTQNPLRRRGATLPHHPSPISGTQFIVILDAKGAPIGLAPMEQLKHTSYPANQIRILRNREELAKIWK